jgi:hypothetical protein
MPVAVERIFSWPDSDSGSFLPLMLNFNMETA